MTLRDDVRATLDGDGTDALAEVGELPAELLGTALGHFADTATLADADALAPIVTASSPVPFDPVLDGVGGEPFTAAPTSEDADPDAFDRVEDRDPADEDPGDFDDFDNVEELDIETEVVADAEVGVEPQSDIDDAFGRGQTTTRPSIELDDSIDELAPAVEPLAIEDEPLAFSDIDPADEPVSDFDPIDLDDAGAHVDDGDSDLDFAD